METDCENVYWIEVAQDHVQWWALLLTVLNLQVLIPEAYVYIYRVFQKRWALS
jgi:hypothetical protein